MDTVKDLFFLHERGFQSGILGMVLVLFSTLAPLICGFLVAAEGWPWYHWLVSVLAGVDMLLIFFLVPETNYKRDLHHALDDAGADDLNAKELPSTHVEQTTSRHEFTKQSYIQELKPWSPVDPQVSIVWPFVRPWITVAFPAVGWATLAFAVHVAR